jgi:sugar phosphate isomerase/epimerase
MYKTLSPGAIGVTAHGTAQAIHAARIGGFKGVEIDVAEISNLVDQHGGDMTRRMFTEAGVRPAAWGLTVDWRNDEDKWHCEMEKLPRYAHAASAIGARRVFTWIMPGSNEREKADNLRFHIDRLKPVAQALAEHNCCLGLEFIGPKTLRDTQKYEFIWTIREMLDLAHRIGPNVGLLLDCWHWYTSHATVEDLKKLRSDQVVYVHVNDAPRDVDVDQQIDSVRDLPGATGVIDIAAFLKALKEIGYDGPVTPEPFKKELADLPSNEARLKQAGAAMDDIWHKAGFA